MSDLELVLEEIDVYKGCIDSIIYRARTMGNIKALEKLCTLLDQLVCEMPEVPIV